MPDITDVAKTIVRLMSLDAKGRDAVLVKLVETFPEQITDMLSQMRLAKTLAAAETQYEFSLSRCLNVTASVTDRNQNLTKDEYHHVAKQLAHGLKVEAIKSIRSYTGLGLKEAKDVSESWYQVYEINPTFV